MIKWHEDEKINVQEQRWFEPVVGAPSDTILPTRGTEDSAGYDFYLPRDVVVPPMSFTDLIPLNVKAKLERGDVLLLAIRSSISKKHHLMLINNLGIIDADYYGNPENDGNIGFALFNFSKETALLKKGERICQGIIVQYGKVKDDNVRTKREGGYGSTGR